MAQKAITVFTPDGEAPHIYAEDDAQVHMQTNGLPQPLLTTTQFALLPAYTAIKATCTSSLLVKHLL